VCCIPQYYHPLALRTKHAIYSNLVTVSSIKSKCPNTWNVYHFHPHIYSTHLIRNFFSIFFPTNMLTQTPFKFTACVCTPVQTLRLCTGRTAYRGSTGTALLYRHWGSVQAVRPIGGVQVQLYSFLTTALEGVRGSVPRPGRSLPPGQALYSLYKRLAGPQGLSGQVRIISPSTGIRSPDRPAGSQSL